MDLALLIVISLLVGTIVGQMSVWRFITNNTKNGRVFKIKTFCWDTDDCEIILSRNKL